MRTAHSCHASIARQVAHMKQPHKPALKALPKLLVIPATAHYQWPRGMRTEPVTPSNSASCSQAAAPPYSTYASWRPSQRSTPHTAPASPVTSSGTRPRPNASPCAHHGPATTTGTPFDTPALRRAASIAEVSRGVPSAFRRLSTYRAHAPRDVVRATCLETCGHSTRCTHNLTKLAA